MSTDSLLHLRKSNSINPLSLSREEIPEASLNSSQNSNQKAILALRENRPRLIPNQPRSDVQPSFSISPKEASDPQRFSRDIEVKTQTSKIAKEQLKLDFSLNRNRESSKAPSQSITDRKSEEELRQGTEKQKIHRRNTVDTNHPIKAASSDPFPLETPAGLSCKHMKERINQHHVSPEVSLSNIEIVEEGIPIPLIPLDTKYLSLALNNKLRAESSLIKGKKPLFATKVIEPYKKLRLISEPGEEAAAFNELFIKSHLRLEQTSLKVTKNMIEENVWLFCKKEIQTQICKEKLSWDQFQRSRTQRCSQMLDYIRNRILVADNGIQNVAAFQLKVAAYVGSCRCISRFAIKLLEYLEQLQVPVLCFIDMAQAVPGNNLGYFLNVIENIESHTNATNKWTELIRINSQASLANDMHKLVIKAFGSSTSDWSQMVKLWRDWNSISPSKFESKIDRIAEACVHSKKIFQYYHHWEQKIKGGQDFSKTLSGITPYDIMRSWSMSGKMYFDEVKIGNALFVSPLNSPQDDSSEEENDLKFTKELFIHLIKNFKFVEAISNQETEDQVDQFLNLALNLRNSENTLSLVNKINKFIPWLNLFRLTTINCWLACNEYLKLLYPELFSKPYTVRCAQGIYCEIEAVDWQNYSVSQKKKYVFSTYEKEVLELTISWTVQPKEEGWAATLKIVDYEMHDNETWDKLEHLLMHPRKIEDAKAVFPNHTFKTMLSSL